jgi:hypothetical protein
MFVGALLALPRSRMEIEYDFAGIVALLAPVALICSWYLYLTKTRREPFTWRSSLTLLSLVLLSVGAFLWPVTMIVAPKADWSTYAGVADQVNFVDSWEKIAVRITSAALVLCFFGRPRLIAPVAIACVGTVLFWFFTTLR